MLQSVNSYMDVHIQARPEAEAELQLRAEYLMQFYQWKLGTSILGFAVTEK